MKTKPSKKKATTDVSFWNNFWTFAGRYMSSGLMSVFKLLKVAGMVLFMGTIPVFVFAQRDKSSMKRAAKYRSEQVKRKEQQKQQAEKAAAKKAREQEKAAAARRKAEEAKARKAAADAEKQAAQKQPKPAKVELIEPREQSVAALPEQQPNAKKQDELDKVVQTDIVPTIDLKTKSNGSTVGNLMALFNEIAVSKKSKTASQAMPPTSKNKVEKGVFEGIKVYRMFIRHNSGFIEKFHYVKEFQTPPANIDELYYYNKLTGKITVRNPLEVGMSTFDKENFLLLHGPYTKTKGEQTYESGSFYLGAKHGRWEKFDKNFVLQEKLYFNKGISRDAELVYEEDAKGRQKLKEIIPLQHGLRHGTYIAYYPSGRVAARGQYVEGCKIGRWTEYYDRDKNPRKRETIYPRRPHDDITQPYVSREWDESGKLIK